MDGAAGDRRRPRSPSAVAGEDGAGALSPAGARAGPAAKRCRVADIDREGGAAERAGAAVCGRWRVPEIVRILGELLGARRTLEISDAGWWPSLVQGSRDSVIRWLGSLGDGYLTLERWGFPSPGVSDAGPGELGARMLASTRIWGLDEHARHFLLLRDGDLLAYSFDGGDQCCDPFSRLCLVKRRAEGPRSMEAGPHCLLDWMCATPLVHRQTGDVVCISSEGHGGRFRFHCLRMESAAGPYWVRPAESALTELLCHGQSRRSHADLIGLVRENPRDVRGYAGDPFDAAAPIFRLLDPRESTEDSRDVTVSACWDVRDPSQQSRVYVALRSGALFGITFGPARCEHVATSRYRTREGSCSIAGIPGTGNVLFLRSLGPHSVLNVETKREEDLVPNAADPHPTFAFGSRTAASREFAVAVDDDGFTIHCLELRSGYGSSANLLGTVPLPVHLLPPPPCAPACHCPAAAATVRARSSPPAVPAPVSPPGGAPS